MIIFHKYVELPEGRLIVTVRTSFCMAGHKNVAGGKDSPGHLEPRIVWGTEKKHGIYLCVCVCVSLYIYIYVHMYIYIYTYIHMYTKKEVFMNRHDMTCDA